MKKKGPGAAYISIAVLSVAAALLMVILALPQARRQVHDWLGLDDRIVLAKLQREMKFADSKDMITVVKLKQGRNLVVEIYRQDQESQKLISTFEFKNEFDAQMIQFHATGNLFFVDRSADIFEIVVPGLDQQMNPRTHVIEFHSETQEFRLKTPPSES